MTKASYLLSLALLVSVTNAAFAQGANPTSEEEAVRRQEKSILLRKTLESAQAAASSKDAGTAAKLYEDAYGLAEQLGAAAEAERQLAATGLSASRLTLAIHAQRAGDLREADAQVSRAIKVDPTNLVAKSFKADNDKRLADMVGKLPSEQALATVPDIRAAQIQAATMVQDGKLMFEMGKLDEAEAILKKAGELNPDNEGAFYYLSLIREARYGRLQKKRSVTTKDRLLEVEQAWEQPASSLPVANPLAYTNRVYTGAGRQLINDKLDRIILNEVKFDGLPLSEVVKFLDEQARLRDPERKGLNFIVNSSADIPQPNAVQTIDPTTLAPVAAAPVEPVDLNSIIIRLSPPLRNVRLADAIDAISKVAEKPLKVSVEDYAVVFTQKLPEPQQLFSRQFRVDPNTFLQGLESVGGFTIADFGGQGGQGGGGGGGGGGAAGGAGGQGGSTVPTIPRIETSPLGGQTGGAGGGGGGGGVGGGGVGGGAGGAGGAGGGGAGQGGFGLTGVTRQNLMGNVQVLVRQFFQAAGVDFPTTFIPGQAGGFGGGGGGGFGGGGVGGIGGGAVGPNGQPLAQGDQKALFFNDRTGILFVRATLSDLDIIEKAIQALNVAPPQVEIEARFVEINQTDNKGLGFQWFLGNFLMGGGKVGASGGTAPSYAGAPSSANPSGVFPGPSGFLADGTEVLSPGLQSPGVTDNFITGGLRNTLADGGQSLPTLATVTGILTEPQFRVFINALEQREGVDLLVAPKVVTLSGRQAQISITDFRTIVTGININQTSAGGVGGGVAQ